MSDFYSDSARRRLELIEAERAAALADLAAHRANSDYESASQTIQAVADLDAAKAHLLALHQNYVASQQAPQQPNVSPEERAARPPTAMDWQDVVEVTRGSRHARNIRPDDPAMIAGWREAHRRRSRGE
jgi:hypothetical protein